MPNTFLIYCLPRSGSQHLSHLLDSAPEIICPGEIFQPKRLKLEEIYRTRMSITDPLERDADPFAFTEQFRRLYPDLHFGFKLLRRHVEALPELKKYLLSPEWRTIFLVRNPIETYASTLRAKKTKVWRQPQWQLKKPDFANIPIHFTPKTLMRFAENYNSFVAFCEKVRVSKNEVFIIDHAQLNDPEALKALLNFIGLNRSDISGLNSGLEKQYSGTISEAFDNWLDLEASLDSAWPFATPLELSYQAGRGTWSEAAPARG
jgi:hypothetical protein